MGRKKKKEVVIVPDSICWTCRHAVPSDTEGCNWSRNAKPIEGWVLYPYTKEKDKGRMRVFYCPQHQRDNGTESCSGELRHFRGLALEIVKKAVVDYRTAYTKWIENETKYEEAIAVLEERDEMESFVKKIRQRYVYNPAHPKAYGYQIVDMVNRIWDEWKIRYHAYVGIYTRASTVRYTIRECERFFRSEAMLMYTDMDGDYIIKLIQNQTRKDYEEGERKKHGQKRSRKAEDPSQRK